MHASELVELAAAVSAQGATLIHGWHQPPVAAVEQYWRSSKSRQDRWSRTIRYFTRRAPQAGSKWRNAQWPIIRAVFEEILSGEILTRVFAAVMSGGDRSGKPNSVEPIARSVLIGHLEARHRVLTILLRGPGIDVRQAALLDNLRRKCERWSDMLLGYLAADAEIDGFAVDPRRAHDYAADLCRRNVLENGANTWLLVKASLKTSFGRGMCDLSVNGDLNQKIAQAVTACFPSEQFDSIGRLQSLWMARLHVAADNAQYLLDELDGADNGENQKTRRAEEARLGRLRKFGFC